MSGLPSLRLRAPAWRYRAASPPLPAPTACQGQGHRRGAPIAASTGGASGQSSSGGGPDLGREAERIAREAQRAASRFVEEQQLKERAAKLADSAAQAAAQAGEQLSDSARRTYVKLDAEYQIQDRVSRAARRAEEQLRDVDQTYSVRRRLRNFVEYVQRMLPSWQRQFNQFAATPVGKVAVFTGIVLLASSTVFWRMLNVAIMLWMLSVPLSLVLLDVARRRQAEAAAQAAADAAERQRRSNPFVDLFRGRAAAGGSRSGGAAARQPQSGSSSSWKQQSGPVIDAEFTSLDDDGGNAKRKK